MYADDVKHFLSYSDYNCQRLLQEDLVALETWCKYNLMRLNLIKCRSMLGDLGSFLLIVLLVLGWNL